MKRIAVLAVVMLTVGLGVAGCTSGTPSRMDSLPRTTTELIAFLRSTVSSDYEPFESPAAMLAAVDVAGFGRVAAVSAGTIATGAEDTGIVIVKLTLAETWKAPASPGELHFWFHRPTNVGIEVYRRSLPLGTGVAVFGYRALPRIVTGAPAAPVYSPTPMGLMFQTKPGTLTNAEDVDGYRSWHTTTTLADLRRAIGR